MRILALIMFLSACTGGTRIPFNADAYAGSAADARSDYNLRTDVGSAAHCAPLPAPAGRTVSVSPRDNLPYILGSLGPGDTALLAPGTYRLPIHSHIRLRTDGVTIRGATGDARDVILDGSWGAPFGFKISASDILIADLTIQRTYFHPVHINPTSGRSIDGVKLYRLRLIDGAQQAVKINPNASATHFADNGVVACSHIELTDAGREKIRDNCYVGGIDAHQARGWNIRDNYIEGYWCESGLARHAVYLWRGSRDTVIERNRIVNVAKGISLGIGQDEVGRRYSDNPCNGNIAQTYGGTILNNTVFVNDPRVFASEKGFDSGVALASACNATVAHNTVASTEAPFAAFEYRFPVTSGVFVNNLTSHNIFDRGVGQMNVSSNIENAPENWFFNLREGNLRLKEGAKAVDSADPAYSPDRDIDGQARAGKPDIGSDEL